MNTDNNIDWKIEQSRQQFQQSVEEYRTRHDHHWRLADSTARSLTERRVAVNYAIKTLVLLNGGALVAMLSFMGNFSENGTFVHQSVQPLLFYIIALTLACCAAIFEAISVRYAHDDISEIAQEVFGHREIDIVDGKPESYIDRDNRKASIRCSRVVEVSNALSLISFMVASAFLVYTFLSVF